MQHQHLFLLVHLFRILIVSYESYYLAGDYKCWITGASNKEALKFLNSAKDIFEYLDDTESEQVNEVNKALEETKDM